jgi:hypothetical protein
MGSGSGTCRGRTRRTQEQSHDMEFLKVLQNHSCGRTATRHTSASGQEWHGLRGTQALWRKAHGSKAGWDQVPTGSGRSRQK